MMDSYQGILYVGDSGRGQSLHAAAAQRGWYVYTPTEVMEALGMFVFYSPSIVVIEAGSDFAREVYRHLRSIQANPLLFLADQAQQQAWALPTDSRVLPLASREDEILSAVGKLLAADEPATV